jgi:hypothetical protein
MTDRFDSDRLDAILASVGEHLVTEGEGGRDAEGEAGGSNRCLERGGEGGCWPRPPACWRWPRSGRRWRTGSASAPPRVERVAEEEGAVGGLPGLATQLRAVTRAEAEAELRGPLPATEASRLGPPDGLGLPPEEGVMMTWLEGDTTLWIHPASFRPATSIAS